jgi:hypothetical protein
VISNITSDRQKNILLQQDFWLESEYQSVIHFRYPIPNGSSPEILTVFGLFELDRSDLALIDQTSRSSFFDQSGDIRLEANVEYRFPIFLL